LLFLGQSYPLRIVDGGRPLDLRAESFQLSKTALPQAERVFERWYRMQARKCFNERVALYASRNGFVYRQVRIGGARTRARGAGAREDHWRLVWRCQIDRRGTRIPTEVKTTAGPSGRSPR
jgi:predicted metal-dependent hydrolase